MGTQQKVKVVKLVGVVLWSCWSVWWKSKIEGHERWIQFQSLVLVLFGDALVC